VGVAAAVVAAAAVTRGAARRGRRSRKGGATTQQALFPRFTLSGTGKPGPSTPYTLAGVPTQPTAAVREQRAADASVDVPTARKFAEDSALTLAGPSSSSAIVADSAEKGALEKVEKSPSTWVALGGAKVIRPPPWVPAKGVVHFIGGAFVGAAPQWTYRRFLMSLAERGLWVIATPLSTSFDHQRLAEDAASTFERAYSSLTSADMVEAKLPVYTIGHSMGALLAAQLGCGAAEAVAPGYVGRLQGQVLIGYNTQSLTGSIPLWKELWTRDELRPVLKGISESLTQVGELTEAVAGTALDFGSFMSRAIGLEGGAKIIGGKERLDDLYTPVLQQFPRLFEDVAEGIKDTPDEREMAKRIPRQYPKDMQTLLIRLKGDPIDQTEAFEKLLRKGRHSPDMVELVELAGNHELPLFNEMPNIVDGTDAMNRAALSSEALFDGALLGTGAQLEGLADAINGFVAPPPEGAKPAPKMPRLNLEGLVASDFRHPLDQRQTRAISRLPGIDIAVRQVVSALERQIYQDNISSSILVGEQQYPWLNDLLHSACDVLDISEEDVPEVYVRHSSEPKAYTLPREGRRAFIVIHTALLEMMCEEEIEAVLAHELGHLKCEHGIWLSAANANMLGAGDSLPLPARLLGPLLGGFQQELQAWQRAAELSCDRTTLLVAQEPWIPLSVIVKLSGGGAMNTGRRALPREQLEAFLDQAKIYDEAKSEGNLFNALLGSLFGSSSATPSPVLRARELRRWADSPEFRRVLGERGVLPLPPP